MPPLRLDHQLHRHARLLGLPKVNQQPLYQPLPDYQEEYLTRRQLLPRKLTQQRVVYRQENVN